MLRIPGLTLETDRLVLRPPQAEDFPAWVAFSADEETMRYLGGAQSASGAWRGFCTVAGAWSVRGFSMFSVIEKATGRWVGRLGPWMPEGWPGTEVGWGLAREVWGRGYATEGARATIDYAFDVLGWTDVIHCIEPDMGDSGAGQGLTGDVATVSVARRIRDRRGGLGGSIRDERALVTAFDLDAPSHGAGRLCRASRYPCRSTGRTPRTLPCERGRPPWWASRSRMRGGKASGDDRRGQ
ncbi:MAG: GNAT family N-acetyltransferase [Deltaproteobacteria bacterium]|nr:MAG: GNAT family N-acetyltransferase [Deltaproteobacteria bacterium]